MEYFLVAVALLVLTGLIGYAWGYYDGKLKEMKNTNEFLKGLGKALEKNALEQKKVIARSAFTVIVAKEKER